MENGFLLFYYATTALSFSLLVLSLWLGYFNYFLFNREQKCYLHYLGFIFIIELTTKLLILFGKENLFVYPIYIAGEFLLLSIMLIIGLNLPRKSIVAVGIISVLLFSEAFMLWITNGNIASGAGKILSHLLIVCMVGYYLIRALKTIVPENPNVFLVIYGGLVLYYSVSLFHFLLMDQLTEISYSHAAIIWGMKNIFSSVLYGASFYTFLRLSKQV